MVDPAESETEGIIAQMIRGWSGMTTADLKAQIGEVVAEGSNRVREQKVELEQIKVEYRQLEANLVEKEETIGRLRRRLRAK